MAAAFQGHACSLVGAAGDSRLALMHAGSKHARRIDGFPRDPRVACGYHTNVGKQSSEDGLLRTHGATVRRSGGGGGADRKSIFVDAVRKSSR